jgi:seryl-tRNA(Sec) selenium transferase
MREPFLNVLVHVTNICGTVLTLNRGDALTTQAQQHLHHLDSGKFW